MPTDLHDLDAVAILTRLAPRSGLSLGSLLARDAEFRLVLASAALQFAPGTACDERKVNATLCAWLETTGAMLSTDHVDLRRWLVDTGLVERDGYGRRYARPPVPPAAFARAFAALEGVDTAAVVAAAREQDRAVRAARRARHAAQAAS